MPLVVDAPREKSFAYNQVVNQLGAVAFTEQTQTVLPEGLDFTCRVKRWQADARGCCPVLQSRINVDWLTFDPQMFAHSFLDSKKAFFGMCSRQKAVVACTFCDTGLAHTAENLPTQTSTGREGRPPCVATKGTPVCSIWLHD